LNARTGLFYAAEFLINFHVGFIGKNNTRRRLIMDGRAIAWFYIMKGHFFVDFLTVLVWIAQAPPPSNPDLCPICFISASISSLALISS